MARYIVTLTEEEREELKQLVQKGGKGYKIKHAQILLKLDRIPENADRIYARIISAYSTVHSTIMDSAMLAMCMNAGLTSAIVNPNDLRLMETVKSCDIVLNETLFADSYLELS